MHFPTATIVDLVAIFVLLVVPRALQRFRLPAPLTCFVLGILAAIFARHLIDDRVATAVATFGIASLFLLAGLEVDLVELEHQIRRISIYLGILAVFLIAGAWFAVRFLDMNWQAATLLALALFVPSTGFILDTMPLSGLEATEQAEVTIDAISGEIIALLVLVVMAQAGSMKSLAISGVILILLIVLTPLLFLFLGRHVVPYAPGSEFSLLIMVGVICAIITKNIGVHYLIGAFTAGLVAGLMRNRMATLASPENLHAVRLFASFFIPFYFFREGLDVPAGALVLKSLLYGAALAIVVIPIRIGKDWLQVRFLSHRSAQGGIRVAVALIPTLIFTLVIASLLRDLFHISEALYGGLLVYAAITTILPSLVLPRLRIEAPVEA
jgi:Kef-type K+ transport system membrane component KefB